LAKERRSENLKKKYKNGGSTWVKMATQQYPKDAKVGKTQVEHFGKGEELKEVVRVLPDVLRSGAKGTYRFTYAGCF